MISVDDTIGSVRLVTISEDLSSGKVLDLGLLKTRGEGRQKPITKDLGTRKLPTLLA